MKQIVRWTAAGIVLMLGLAAARADEPTRLRTIAYPVADIVTAAEEHTEVIDGATIIFSSYRLPVVKYLQERCPRAAIAGKFAIPLNPTGEEALVTVIATTIQPSDWGDAGGRCSIQYQPLGMAIVVTATRQIHKKIADLLDEVRSRSHSRTFDGRLVEVAKDGDGDFKALPKFTIAEDQTVTIYVDGHPNDNYWTKIAIRTTTASQGKVAVSLAYDKKFLWQFRRPAPDARSQEPYVPPYVPAYMDTVIHSESTHQATEGRLKRIQFDAGVNETLSCPSLDFTLQENLRGNDAMQTIGIPR